MVKTLSCVYSVAAVTQDHFSTNRLKNYSDTSEGFFVMQMFLEHS